MQSLTITRPDDWHVHLRDGDALRDTVAHCSRYFGRAIVMPNLTPPVNTVAKATAYRERILAVLDKNSNFRPLMVLYLTDNTDATDIERAKQSGIVVAAKLYPAGATTNSDAGVTDISKIYSVLEAMQRHKLPLLVHGEVANDEVDIFDREKSFLETHLQRIVHDFPILRVVLEHITTRDAVQFVEQNSACVAATITAHHLLFNRNHLLAGGVRPHYYCLPVLKRASHQHALVKAAISGNPKFFLGTDSAPHPQSSKETACGCAGCYTAHAALELYAEAFERAGALDKLEGFASFFGPDFYQLPRNNDTVTLHKEPWQVPRNVQLGAQQLVPIGAANTLQWQVGNREPA
ncbi:MAG: dihydroorotase [Pseudomonadales bacterium]